MFDHCRTMEGASERGWDALGNANVAGTASDLEAGLMDGSGSGRRICYCGELGGSG